MYFSVYPSFAEHKKNFLIGSLFIFAITLLPSVSGYLVPMTNLDLYLENELIVMGQVVSAIDFQDDSNSSLQTTYEITILQHIKGNTETDEITVVGLGSTNSTRQLDKQIIMSKGQQVLLILNSDDENYWHVSPYSTSSNELNPDTQFILPPLKLYKAGIPIEDIHCKSNLELALKSSNGSPVCLQDKTLELLNIRGWLR